MSDNHVKSTEMEAALVQNEPAKIPLSYLRDSGKNVRLAPPTEELKAAYDTSIQELASSILNRGLLTPILVTEDVDDAGNPSGTFTIVCGHRRYAALKSLALSGWTAPDGSQENVPCVILSADDSSAYRAVMLAENLQREGLPPYDLMVEIAEMAKTRTQREVAKEISKSEGLVSGLMRVHRKGIQPLHRAFQDRRIGIDAAISISGYPEEEQEKLLKKALAGGKALRNAIEQLAAEGSSDAAGELVEKPKRPSGKQIRALLRLCADISEDATAPEHVRDIAAVSHLVASWVSGHLPPVSAGQTLHSMFSDLAEGNEALFEFARNGIEARAAEAATEQALADARTEAAGS